MKCIILLIILSNIVFAYTPTIESLFRNGDNDTVIDATVSANFVISRQNNLEQSSETLQELPAIYSYKFVFNNEEKKPSQFIQLTYNGNVISSSSLLDLKYFPQMTFNSLKLSGEDVEKKLFYSLMHSLINNDGSLMIEFLNSIGLSALKNTERVNRDQIQLISKYINFLKRKKEDPENTELKNPLEPEDPEERKLVREIMKKPFLTRSPYIERVMQDKKIYYAIRSETVEIMFGAENHELVSLKVKTEQGEVEANLYNYLVYSTINRKLKFPQLILLKDLQGNEYKLEMKKLRAYNENLDSFLKRLNQYRKDMNKGLDQETLGKSSFTL
jgi:hypothetical protein